MLGASVTWGAENPTDPCSRKNLGPGQSKGLKQRTKALSDVKNTLHSHTSSANESSKNGKKKGVATRKKGKLNGTASFVVPNIDENSTSVLDGKKIGDIECHNHFICEKGNSFNHTEFLSEYRLTKNEINFLSNRTHFFGLDVPQIKPRCVSPVEELEISEIKIIKSSNQTLEFDDEDTVIFDIPEPEFLS